MDIHQTIRNMYKMSRAISEKANSFESVDAETFKLLEHFSSSLYSQANDLRQLTSLYDAISSIDTDQL